MPNASLLDALRRSFYLRETREVAWDLPGKILVREMDGALLAGRIVETVLRRSANRRSFFFGVALPLFR